MKTTPRFSLRTLASLLVLGTFIPQFSHAADYTWVPATGGTWDTTTANWNDGVTNPTAWVNGSANNASFTIAGGGSVSLGVNIVGGTLFTNGGGTINFTGGVGTSIDVSRIQTAGTSGSNGSIDMNKVLTGNHDFTLHSTGSSGNQGRLNLKVAANYTGNTFLTGNAYFLIDGTPDNLLPTSTIVSLGSTTTLRLAKGGTQLLTVAGLSGAGTFTSQAGTAQQHKLVINTSSANAAQTFTGALNNSTSTLSLEIAGSGTQTISGGAKNYGGSTVISAGTLVLGSTLTNSSSVSVTGGTLQTSANLTLGAGDVSMSSGNIDIRGLASTGLLTVAATKDFITTGGTIKFDLDTTATLDQIAGSGLGSNFSLTNTTIALNLITWSAPDYANTYTLFTGFVDPGLVSGVTITGYDAVNYTASLSSAGVLSFTAVPEPSSVALLALGGISLALSRARARRRQL